MKENNVKKARKIIEKYDIYKNDPIQEIQLAHRIQLVEAFDIKEGMHVLEIGCGQGDTTIVLADAVGESGRITAIDIASKEYGAPLTLEEAADRIMHTSLGDRITFHFETDFLNFEEETVFDAVVLSHASWYFENEQILINYIEKVKAAANQVCFAEWDLDYTRSGQRAHFLAASLLALHSSQIGNGGNIQCLFGKRQVKEILEKTGFQITGEIIIDAAFLQDGGWEINEANDVRADFDKNGGAYQSFLDIYYHLMNHQQEEAESLDSFVICAKR
ncbi:SAM-dependent methyltransferase [Oceanobacillus neutriphilus]|uniref:SAM-dependent methyltransferase n=1 Tax=Oceanobacillus neutriphilus TaxID=531815 RepID=A0ABQ2NZU6_9BACI|nr:class I SAM-dependent methyltransferase [Oceanobacillus neutriphilus]GGP14708.1 SAM-dependent methyltransferase [Oceanobacillus neutriphilus]